MKNETKPIKNADLFIKENFIYGVKYNPINIWDFDFLEFLPFFFDKYMIDTIIGSTIGDLRYPYVDTIDVYCKECGRETTFESSKNHPDNVYSFVNNIHQYSLLSLIEENNKPEVKKSFEKFLTDFNNLGTITRDFICTHSKTKDILHYFSVSYKLEGDKIIKVGQYPSIDIISKINLYKYNEINKDLTKELISSHYLYMVGKGIAAYVYLRRIIEKYIVDAQCEKALLLEGKTKEEIKEYLRKNKFQQKIKYTKNIISDLLQNQPKIFKVLSSGIHSLTEEECLDVFLILYKAILIILDEQIEILHKEKDKKEITFLLNKL